MKSQKTILIIEDNPVYLSVLQKRLGSRGYNTVLAGDGLEGYNLARKVRPDLILLDLMLPVMDGHKVCRLIKFNRTLRDTPVAIFTSRDTEGDERQAKAFRADAYMVKTISPGCMIGIIEQLLEKADRIREGRGPAGDIAAEFAAVAQPATA
jgi:two-component system, OmpR family, alkaline phosphatase synthesis response regulator PhoP